MKYKKIHITFVIILVIICIIAVPLLSRVTIKTSGYSTDNVYNTIKELSSNEYEGRRYGTAGNLKAVKYIEEQFKAIGLEPGGDYNSYLINHTESTRIYNGAAVLEVLGREGNIIKKYKYGEDFIEQGYGYSAPGELTSGFSIVDPYAKEFNGKTDSKSQIAIAFTQNRSLEMLKSYCVTLGKAGYLALITTVPDTTNFRDENASVGNGLLYKSGYELPTLIIKDKIAKELQSYSNNEYKMHLKSTFDIAPAVTPDVLGVIPGKGETSIIISANMDSIGTSSDGVIFPGALDNASGVGALIELARFIKSQGKVPSQTIIFAAFNGQEGGFLGSANYVHRTEIPLYTITSAVNLDMIGSKKSIPLTIAYNSVHSTWVDMTMDPSSKLRYHIKNLAKSMGIETKEVDAPISDHTFFNSGAVPAISLMDYDEEMIHSPHDTIDNIGNRNVDRTLGLVANYISMTAYSNISPYGYTVGIQEILNIIKDIYPLLLGITAILVLFYLQYRKKINPKKRLGNFPFLTIAAVILFSSVINYFPISYPYAPTGASQVLSLIGNSFLYDIKSLLTLPLFLLFFIPSLIVLVIFKRRLNGSKYDGSGKEYTVAYYISILIYVIASLYISGMYGQLCHLTFTPDFARDTGGRLLVYAFLALVSYLVSRLLCFERGIIKRSYTSFLSFAIIFFILLSAFFTPISTNRFVMDLNYRGVSTHSPNAFD